MDDIANHRALIFVSKTGSYSVAAERLGISKVMISRAIKTLETDLGFRLLDRTTKGSKLTPKGKAYVDFCEPTIRNIEESVQALVGYKRDFKQKGSNPAIRLKLSSPNTFGSIVISQVISDFHQAYPNILVELITDDAFKDIFEHQLDIAIRAHLTSESILENTISRKLIKLPFTFCCTPDYLTHHGQPESIEALFVKHAFVAWTYLNQQESVTINHADNLAFIPKKIAFISNNSLACLNSILTSHGIGFLPYHVIRDSLKRGELVALFCEQTCFEADIRVTYLNSQGPQSVTAMFVDYLISSPWFTELKNEIVAFNQKQAPILHRL
ncbi:hypothetical protein BCU94_16325 [Shewanella sp. 10N.286.52.C2]|uniref:LysR family transcriptional regulator n=1 Tax=unclassified Shewanella TaxID=196818 RepID=UPI000C81E11C|nr:MULTISPECIES: LysR family transcriptional regulator [unclassified Shewanella]PMG28601.1 hypothetical protein BCU94_16325 [Shewanella sp. 10N.286.52.C2]PMH94741.1 hypothetical protein BCU55_03695 [Shewanella sp. 10N.286.48.A6]